MPYSFVQPCPNQACGKIHTAFVAEPYPATEALFTYQCPDCKQYTFVYPRAGTMVDSIPSGALTAKRYVPPPARVATEERSNKPLQQTAAAMLIPRRSTALRPAPVPSLFVQR